MNKPLIYSYICELENELKSICSKNRFKDLICSEIINSSIIDLHELDDSSKSDEETAKGIVLLNIDSFYAPKKLLQIEDKYWNWDNRLQYGFRGRIMTTPDNLIRFRSSVDTTSKEVNEERAAMRFAVKNHSFTKTENRKRTLNLNRKHIIVVAIILSFALGGLWLYSVNNRYMRVNEITVFDKWKGEVIDVTQTYN